MNRRKCCGQYTAASGSSGVYDPIFSESGGVLDICCQHSEVTSALAGVSSPEDISTGAWTRTQLTASSATHLVVDGTPTTPSLRQAITGVGSGNPCTPMLIVFEVKYTDIPYICVESQVGTSFNRSWFKIDDGTVGTSGTRHHDEAIGAADGSGWRRVSLVVEANGGNQEVIIRPCTADNVTTSPAAATSFDVREDPTYTGWVYQRTASAIADRVTGNLIVQATADLQPGFGNMPIVDKYGINSLPALRANGGPGRMFGSDAGVIAAFTGEDKPYTWVAVVQFDDNDLLTALFGVGAAADAANNSRFWGTVTTGGGRYRHSSTSGAGVTVNSDATADIASDTSPKLLTIHSDGTTLTWRENGVVIASLDGVAHDPGTMTPDRWATFCVPTSGQANRADARIGTLKLWNVQLDAAAIARVEAFVAAEWGISI